MPDKHLNIFFRAFAYNVLRRIPFCGKFVGECFRYAAEVAMEASVCRFYICGIPILTLRQLDEVTSFELGKGLPILSVKQSSTKLCGYIGPLEVFKIRFLGPRPIPSIPPSFIPVQRKTKKIFLNIGRLHKNDGQYGIARVALCLYTALRKLCPQGYEVWPVYATAKQAGFLYANRYVRRHFEEAEVIDRDYPIELSRGDIFIDIVADIDMIPLQKKACVAMREAGVKVFAMCHDLIPISHPQYIERSLQKQFPIWLQTISAYDGVISPSSTVAEEYRLWRNRKWPNSSNEFLIDWFHLGADFNKVANSVGMPDSAKTTFAAMQARPSLLEVSTIEPRKGHRQALAAFEQLWAKGVEINYVIVGNKGWLMDDFVNELEKHPELNKRLFWLRGISDEYLNKIYDAASAVLFPSEAEGFGLAVVEGAMHGKPLILRDLPVFREIAGKHATYFSGLEPQSLVDCLERWLEDFKKNKVISTDGIKPLTWEESAKMFLSRLPLMKRE